MSKIRIAGATINQTPLDWENNFQNIREAIKMAKDKQIKILCLPEMALIGYGNEDMLYSEWLPEKALNYLLQLRPYTQDIAVAIGLPVRKGKELYNCMAVIQDGDLLGITAKQFLAFNEVYYEPRWFIPWKAGIKENISLDGKEYPFGDVSYELYGIKTAFEICEDAWRGNVRPARAHMLNKMDLIMNPSASHFAFGKTFIREKLMIESSKEFDCTYIYANLLGNESGRVIFDGEIIITQKGSLIQKNRRLSFQDVNIAFADVDFQNPDNSTADLVQDIYDKYEEFPQALSLALFDYLRKSRSRGFVLSLSGGADSSTCAVMISEMVKRASAELGIYNFLEKAGFKSIIKEIEGENITPGDLVKLITNKILTCAYQGTINSTQATLNSARDLADEIGAVFYKWEIDEEVLSYSSKIEKVIGRKLTWEQDDITMQNIQARARSPIIWMLANINNALLITTSNRSEGDVGYATMDGDTSGSIAPIAGVDKYFILQWLRWAEKNLDYQSLSHVNNLQPSAELRPVENNQTDEADLMPYNIIVEIEKLAIRDKKSPKEVFQILNERKLEEGNLLKSHVKKFFTLWSRTQWKRERLAPSFHLDDLNVDPRSWMRFPILSGGFIEELKELD
jgi:NAD+ synthase (glutamine-hydrolysing)